MIQRLAETLSAIERRGGFIERAEAQRGRFSEEAVDRVVGRLMGERDALVEEGAAHAAAAQTRREPLEAERLRAARERLAALTEERAALDALVARWAALTPVAMEAPIEEIEIDVPEPDEAPVVASRALLIGREGTSEEWIWPIDGATQIGRGRRSELQILDDSRVSRAHCAIRRDADGGFWIEDLGSSNGSLVEGQWIAAPRPLADGEEILLGATSLRFRLL